MTNDMLRAYMLKFVGLPYIWGGDDPIIGFDCSGFAQEILSAFGAHPSPGEDLNAQNLYDKLLKTGGYNQTMPGALAFYGKQYNSITHVAVLFTADLIVEAGGGGSRTLTPENAAAQNAFIRIRPLKRRSDLLCTVMPAYPFMVR